MANQQINLNVHGKTGSPTAYTARSGVINRLHVEPRSNIELRPGLTAQVDIKARERTVLNYLTKPIVKTLSESLGER